MRRCLALTTLLTLLVLGAHPAAAQSAFGNFALVVRPPAATQYSLKVDNSVSPNRLNGGCEGDALTGSAFPGNATVNGYRLTGAATGSAPTLAAVACASGDANISLNLATVGTGTVNIVGTAATSCYTINGDVFLCRRAAASWGLGSAASATPTAQVFGAQNGAGTNIAGGALTLRPGNGTGTGGSGTFEIDVAYPGTTGTTADTFTAAFQSFSANTQASGAAFSNPLFLFTGTVNQSGSAGYCLLCASMTETATGSGSKNLVELQVGAADKFVVDDTGQIATGFLAARTDVTMFYQATTNCVDTSASTLAVPVRAAANDVSLSRTAGGAETHNFTCFLTAPTRSGSGKGYKLTAFSIAQQITVANLTSNTFNGLATTAYVNNVADAVAAYGGAITITMPTATQANPYVTAGTVGTAAFENVAASGVSVDWTAVMANTGVYSVKGILATWTVQD